MSKRWSQSIPRRSRPARLLGGHRPRLRSAPLLLAAVIAASAAAHEARAQRFLRGGGDSPPPTLERTTPKTVETPAASPLEITVRPGGSPAASPSASAGRPGRGGAKVRVTTFPGSPRPYTSPARAVTAPDILAWQAALDRAGFSPGLIDGEMGQRTRMALQAFQEYAGMPVSGVPDQATAQALGVADQPALRYTVITANDEMEVGPNPTHWEAKARLKRLKYPSLAALVAERGHCSQATLARLNPGVDLRKLRAGHRVLIPNVTMPRVLPRANLLEVDYGNKTISAFDGSGRRIALFPCSIARNKDRRLTGTSSVTKVVMNPQYTFNPAMWPEVKDVHRVLTIPPGPRNPVGVCWIGLATRGYGIHGTPEPENIGKTGSHGCFRLTNWNVTRLALMVRVGTPVRFIDSSARGR